MTAQVIDSVDGGGSVGRGNGSESDSDSIGVMEFTWKGGDFWGLGGTGVMSGWG